MYNTWNALEGKIDQQQFKHVKTLLGIQQQEALWWRNSCLLYFQSFSKNPIPASLEKPEYTLEYYEKLTFPYAPGIRPGW
jgi:alpha-glucuronidase